MNNTLSRFGSDILGKCCWARDYNDGHPNPAWSTGEKLAVALVLDDKEFLNAEDYTIPEAKQRVFSGSWEWRDKAHFDDWLVQLRALLDTSSD
ncbi:hypothetical protein [Stackebrandtia nassauensis]|uniref:Uncharacterized protein n=1 Tax=Stackebrandtia nassauensis (strain DSM 44728 / CIP 108903 / NRRL B-16338 / NBRC 102104 / LLR-40K-21) TaxID=446470 RepID=D3Q3Z8_STANL|nr:hypothetical protein [Stackebrandtia nassauensis]ADD45883.1 hypothetical protein Snas_6263 [Stackebrandtia nassauensis DSM 44728]